MRSVRSPDSLLSTSSGHGVGRSDSIGDIIDQTIERIIGGYAIPISVHLNQSSMTTRVLFRCKGIATKSSMQNYIQRQECSVEYSILPIIQYYKD